MCINLKFRQEVNFFFATDRAILKLHRRFLNKNRPTDVLTFVTRKRNPHDVDIAISLDRAGRQARLRKLRLRHEVALLMCHGLLHALGMDDQTEQGWLAMRQAEFASLAKTL